MFDLKCYGFGMNLGLNFVNDRRISGRQTDLDLAWVSTASSSSVSFDKSNLTLFFLVFMLVKLIVSLSVCKSNSALISFSSLRIEWGFDVYK